MILRSLGITGKEELGQSRWRRKWSQALKRVGGAAAPRLQCSRGDEIDCTGGRDGLFQENRQLINSNKKRRKSRWIWMQVCREMGWVGGACGLSLRKLSRLCSCFSAGKQEARSSTGSEDGRGGCCPFETLFPNTRLVTEEWQIHSTGQAPPTLTPISPRPQC